MSSGPRHSVTFLHMMDISVYKHLSETTFAFIAQWIWSDCHYYS